MMLSSVLVVCAAIAMATGRSTGPPLSSCGTMKPTGHINSGFQPQDLGFTALASELGTDFLITVTGTQNLKGIFIQVRDSSDTAVGTFTTEGVPGFQTLPCFGRPNSAFAHSDGSDKGSIVAAVWTPPDDCSGTLTVRATVVVAFITFQVEITDTLVCPPPITEAPMTSEEPPPPPPMTSEEPPPPPPPMTSEEPPPPPMTTEEPPPPPMTTEEPPPPPPMTSEEPPPPPPMTSEEPPPPPPPMTSEEPPPPPMTTEEPPPPPMTTEEPPPPPMTSEEPPPPPPMTTEEPPPAPMTTEEPPPPPMTTEEPPPPPMTSEEPPPMTSEEPPPMTTEEPPPMTLAPMTKAPMTTKTMTEAPAAMETTELGRVVPITPSKLPSVVGSGCRYSAMTKVPPNKYISSFETRSTGGWMLAGRRNPMYAFSSFRFFHRSRNIFRQPKWTRNMGSTPSKGTGPTSAADGKYYMYLEASEPMQQGDKVSLYTRNDLRGCFCVQFYHHHNVQNFKRPYDQHKLTVHSGFRMKKMSRSKPHNSWQKVAVQFDEKFYTKVRIVGTRGKDWRGDMAIDKVSITAGMCPK